MSRNGPHPVCLIAERCNAIDRQLPPKRSPQQAVPKMFDRRSVDRLLPLSPRVYTGPSLAMFSSRLPFTALPRRRHLPLHQSWLHESYQFRHPVWTALLTRIRHGEYFVADLAATRASCFQGNSAESCNTANRLLATPSTRTSAKRLSAPKSAHAETDAEFGLYGPATKVTIALGQALTVPACAVPKNSNCQPSGSEAKGRRSGPLEDATVEEGVSTPC